MFLRRLKQINFQLASWVPLPPHTNSIIINGFSFSLFSSSSVLFSSSLNALGCAQPVCGQRQRTVNLYVYYSGLQCARFDFMCIHTMAMPTRKQCILTIRRNNRSVFCFWWVITSNGLTQVSRHWATHEPFRVDYDLQLQSMAFDRWSMHLDVHQTAKHTINSRARELK